MEKDLVLNIDYQPSFNEILDYIIGDGKMLWSSFTSHLEKQFQAKQFIEYSKCSGKPGWNVKYKKSGKSICTLYPEKEGFVALVVIKLDLVPIIESNSNQFEDELLGLIRNAKPFNGTLWLMIPVYTKSMLNGVKKLLEYKALVK